MSSTTRSCSGSTGKRGLQCATVAAASGRSGTAPFAVPRAPNDRWSLDFVSDQLTDGRRFRIFTVIDDCTRECLPLVADISLSGTGTGPRRAQMLAGRLQLYTITFTARIKDAVRAHLHPGI
jgi:transposase InsO family protein